MMAEMPEKKRANWVSWLLLGVLAVLILSVVVLSCVPPVSRDALVHHLAVPKLYLKHGGMYEIPFMPFSYYPMNLDLLYLIPLYFGNDIIPKFVHFSFALLTGWLIFRYLRRRSTLGFALFGSLFFLSIPIIVKLSISIYVDLGVSFFSFASLLFLLEWSEGGRSIKVLILAAVMAGLAMGTKYNGMVTAVLLALFVPVLHPRKGRGHFFSPALSGLLYLLIAFLVFSPWMVRNYSWKKNPIYPLYEHRIHPPKSSNADEKKVTNGSINSGLGVFVIRKGLYRESWWEIAMVPIRIFIEGRDGSPKHFDGKLNPFLLLLPFFAFWRIRQDPEEVRREKKAMLAFAVLFFAIAFFTSDLRIRYIAPMIPVLVILSVMGAERLHDAILKGMKGRGRRIVLGVWVTALASALAYNGQYMYEKFKEVKPMAYISGKMSRDEYLERHSPEYAAMRFINRQLPQDAKVMLIFLGGRGYYCDRDYVYEEGSMGQVFLRSENGQEIYSKLKGMGITHLLIYDPLFLRWVGDNGGEKSERSLDTFFLNYVKLIYSGKRFSVFALENDSS